MNVLSYIQAAVRTEHVPHTEVCTSFGVAGVEQFRHVDSLPGITGTTKVRLLHSALGMSTEIAELQNAFERDDRTNVLEEIGDVLWYWAIAIETLNPLTYAPPEDEERLRLSVYESERRLIAAICHWADVVRKYTIHCKDLSRAEAHSALFDVWSAAGGLCRSLGTNVESVMQRNIAKLHKRFPEKYDGVLFEERDLPAERKALESDT